MYIYPTRCELMSKHIYSKISFFIVILILPVLLNGQANWKWAIDGTDGNYDVVKDVFVDSAGNTYACGNFDNTLTIQTITINSNSATQKNGFLAKFDANGNIVWLTPIHSLDLVSCNALTVDKSGNVYVVGKFKGTPTFYGSTNINLPIASNTDAFLANYDVNGNVIWAKSTLGSTNRENAKDVCVDDNNVYVIGHFFIDCDWNPSPGPILNASGQNDVYVCAFDNSGNFLWQQSYGSSSQDAGKTIAVLNNKLYIAGFYASAFTLPGTPNITLPSFGGNDAFIAQLNKFNGNTLWAIRAGGIGNEDVNSLVVINDKLFAGGFTDNLFTLGMLNFIPSGAADAFIAKLDTNGVISNLYNIGGSGGDTIFSLTVDGNNNLIAAGSFANSVDFGGSSLTATGTSNMFVAAYDTLFNVNCNQ
jgi:hypothetical protein